MNTDKISPPVDQETNEGSLLVVRRKGNTPLRFRGREIGSAEENLRDNDCHRRVTIYRTRGGSFVVERVFDAAFIDRIERDGFTSANAAELVAWLREENGEIGSVARTALARASANDHDIDAAFGEDIP